MYLLIVVSSLDIVYLIALRLACAVFSDQRKCVSWFVWFPICIDRKGTACDKFRDVFFPGFSFLTMIGSSLTTYEVISTFFCHE